MQTDVYSRPSLYSDVQGTNFHYKSSIILLFPAVAKEDCGHVEYSEVCGVDSTTYPTLCHLQQSGVKLAYSGRCRPELCGGTVCGRNGVTYPSSCHARAHNVRVDYKRTCFAEE